MFIEVSEIYFGKLKNLFQININDLGSGLLNVSITGEVTKCLVGLSVIGNTKELSFDSQWLQQCLNQDFTISIITHSYLSSGCLCLVFDLVNFLHNSVRVFVVFGCL